MSTIKSSSEHLTLNADGSGKEVKIQRDGTQVMATTASGIDVTGSVTAGDGATGSPVVANKTGNQTQGNPAFTWVGNTGTGMRRASNDTIAFDTGAVERMTIANDGKVKIPSSIHTSDSTSLAVQDINGTAVGFGQLYLNRDDTATVDQVVFGKNGTQVGKIQTTGSGTLYNTGSGGGIDFSANSHYSGMSSEVLDDYEEGTWTPTLYPGTQSYSQQLGRYTKLGNVVHVSCVLLMSSTSVTGSARIDGLPYQPSGTPYYIPTTSAAEYMSITANHNFQAIQYGNNSFVYLFEEDANGGMQQLNNTSKFTNTSGMYFTLTYNTNA